MVREISAGGVVLHRMQDRWWIAAIEPQPSDAQKNDSKRKQVWALPKGLVDQGESPQKTAEREIREETGVDATLISKLTDIKYTYTRTWGDRERVFKIVSFYLFRYTSGTLGEISPEMRIEVRTCDWVPLDEAPHRLSYSGERQVVKLAQAYVNSHPEI